MEQFLRSLHTEVKQQGADLLYSKCSFKTEIALLQHTNPNSESHNLNLPKFLLILQNLEPERLYRVLDSLVGEFGFELDAKEKVGACSLTTAMMRVSKETADLTLAVHQALEDNHVNQMEKAQIRREIQHVRLSLDGMEESVKVA